MKKTIHPVIIIGSGPAGLTAAIYTARANLSPIVFEGKNPGGQLMGTTIIDNWPGNPGIQGPKLMMIMQQQAKDAGAELIQERIVEANITERPFSLKTETGEEYLTNSVIISTGTTPNRLHCPGEEKYWGKGVSTCTTCDGALYRGQNVVVVGGGDGAMESALFLQSIGNNVTIVHILDKLTASYAMQQRVFNEKIKIVYQHTVTEISGTDERVTGVMIQSQTDQSTQSLEVDGVFLTIGARPNTGIFKGQIKLTDYGHIKTRDHVGTSLPGIFAAGDVHDPRYRQAIASAGFGCIAALEVQRYLEEQKK
jgi:thioredoxin reductase (NADPH)